MSLDFTRKTESERLEIANAFLRQYNGTISTTFHSSYIKLYPYIRCVAAEGQVSLQNPLEYHVNTSPLIQLLRKGHHQVVLSDDAWQRLITWIDLGAPDFGSWKYSVWDVPENFYERRLESFKQFAGREIDVERIPEASDEIPAFIPPVQTPPEQTPAPKAENWPFTSEDAKNRQKECSLPTSLEIEMTDGLFLEFALIPPGQFISQQWNGYEKKNGDSVVAIDAPFYLSKTEITNAKFQALGNPNHQSGFMEWQSFDNNGEGYTLHRAEQPAVRVSWNEAEAFCKKLSEKVGRPVLLPDMFQWEWAARCGSETPFWFGDLESDFSGFENLAGEELVDFATYGQPVTWLRSSKYVDRSLVSAPVQSFRPNPWGLYDMNGNVSEWTSSDWPFPPGEWTAESPAGAETSLTREKVVCGGSWMSRPVDAASSVKWKYPVMQKVYNVGFRVMIPVNAAK